MSLPLFYRDPRLLSRDEHGDSRLLPGDFAFAATTPFVPLLLGEFVEAARHYPIVFAASDSFPIVLLGLGQANLYVEEGDWEAEAYVPAYVRRYPFGAIETGPDRFMLAIDVVSDRLAQKGEEGVPLFQDEEPSALLRSALGFCEAFQAQAARCRAFGAALRAQDLLIEQRVDAELPDGSKLGMQGFQIVDLERFHALPEAVVLEWHREGWLQLVAQHLGSLDRFERLLARQTRWQQSSSVEEPV